MSNGVLLVREQVAWDPASGDFDEVMDLIAGELAADAEEMRTRLLRAKTDQTGGWLDISGWDPVAFRTLLEAYERGYERLGRIPPGSPDLPGPRQRFFWGLTDLKGALRTDGRAGEPPSPSGEIVVSNRDHLALPALAYDLLLERVGAYLRPDAPRLWTWLLGCRTAQGGHRCDLRPLSPSDQHVVLQAAGISATRIIHSPDVSAWSVRERFLPYDAAFLVLLRDHLQPGVRKTLQVQGRASWQAPAALCDLLLDLLAAAAPRPTGRLWARLVECRRAAGGQVCDLGDLSPEEIGVLLDLARQVEKVALPALTERVRKLAVRFVPVFTGFLALLQGVFARNSLDSSRPFPR